MSTVRLGPHIRGHEERDWEAEWTPGPACETVDDGRLLRSVTGQTPHRAGSALSMRVARDIPLPAMAAMQERPRHFVGECIWLATWPALKSLGSRFSYRESNKEE